MTKVHIYFVKHKNIDLINFDIVHQLHTCQNLHKYQNQVTK